VFLTFALSGPLAPKAVTRGAPPRWLARLLPGVRFSH
jgi:hypothetical protein